MGKRGRARGRDGRQGAVDAGSLRIELTRRRDDEIDVILENLASGEAVPERFQALMGAASAQEAAGLFATVGGFPPPTIEAGDYAVDGLPPVHASFDRDVVVVPESPGRVSVQVVDSLNRSGTAAELGPENVLLLIQRLIDAYGEAAGADATEIQALRKLKAEALALARKRRKD